MVLQKSFMVRNNGSLILLKMFNHHRVCLTSEQERLQDPLKIGDGVFCRDNQWLLAVNYFVKKPVIEVQQGPKYLYEAVPMDLFILIVCCNGYRFPKCINSFHVTVHFIYPLKTSENNWFSDGCLQGVQKEKSIMKWFKTKGSIGTKQIKETCRNKWTLNILEYSFQISTIFSQTR